MKKLAISIIFCCVLFGLNAQNASEEKPTTKLFYSELGGPGVLFSANLDSRFNSASRLGLGYRIGLGFAIKNFDGGGYYDKYGEWQYEGPSSYGTIPIGINYLFGKEYSTHIFEVGGGATILTKKVSLYNLDNARSDRGNLIGQATFMYRRQPINGGFTFRVGFMTVIGTGGDFLPSGAIGFGYSF